MEYIATSAIVLKKTQYKDFKYIVQVFSEKYGVFSADITLNNYIRPPHINVPNICQIVVAKSKNKNYSIREVKPIYIYKELYTNVKKNIITQFIIEVLTKTISENYSDEKLFQFIKEQLILLDTRENSQLRYFHLIFLKNYINILGITPLNNYTSVYSYFNLKEGKFVSHQNSREVLSKEDSEMIYQLFYQNTSDLSHFPVNSCTHYLLDYIQYHHSAHISHSLNMLKEMVIGLDV